MMQKNYLAFYLHNLLFFKKELNKFIVYSRELKIYKEKSTKKKQLII